MTSATVAKTILISSKGGLRREAVAAAVIRPGSLVHTNANLALVVHGTAGQEGQPAFAVEYDLTGRGIDDNYAVGDQVLYHILPDGERVNALIEANHAVAVNAQLTSAGNGTLRTAAAGEFVYAIARQAVAAEVGVVKRCIVEIAAGRKEAAA